MLSKEYLQSLFDYRDGELYWKITKSQKTKAGNKFGCPDKYGYQVGSIDYKVYKAHRLIFTLFHGYLPKEVDHVNGDKTDNRIENLRAVTNSQNQYNKCVQKNNTSGCKNVSWDQSISKWVVRVSFDKTQRYIGSFTDLKFADLVAQEARYKYHGVFARHK